MKTSWLETLFIDTHFQNKLKSADQVLFNARLLVDPLFKSTVHFQQKTYQLVTAFGRRKLKSEIKQVEKELFEHLQHEDFQNKVKVLFDTSHL